MWPSDAAARVGGARPAFMKDLGYPPTQKLPFTVARIGAARTWPPAPRAGLRPSAPPMFGDTNVAPAPAQAGPPYGQRERLGITNAAQQIPEKFGGGRGIRTPKGPAPRWISSPLPYQLRLALRAQGLSHGRGGRRAARLGEPPPAPGGGTARPCRAGARTAPPHSPRFPACSMPT